MPGNIRLKIREAIIENKKDPKLPDIVLFGLMDVNFGPPIVFPTTKPPVSENTQITIAKKSIIFKVKIFDKRKNKIENNII